MCVLKEYNNSMKEYAIGLVIRIDIYSMPSAYGNLIDLFKEDATDFVVRKLRDDEMITIDIDSCSDVTGRSLNELMAETCYILTLSTEHITYRVYVHPNFVAFAFKDISSKNYLMQFLHENSQRCRNFNGINTLDVSIILQHCALNINVETLWQTFDKTAFPIMDEDSYNGQYIDSSTKGDIHCDLHRTISPSPDNESNYDIVITAIAFADISSNYYDENQSHSISEELINVVFDETTKCFI